MLVEVVLLDPGGDNQATDAFPGASLLSAGNLCRQTVEQIAFILCVYGGVPKEKYLRPNRQLKLLHSVLKALGAKDPIAKRTHWTIARKRGPRIAKFVRLRVRLDQWRNWFNETSHYSAPGHRRSIGEAHVRAFLQELRTLIDGKDFGLVGAAYNEIMSDGSLRADLADDPENTPAIFQTIVMRVKDIQLTAEKRLGIHFARGEFQVLPDDAERKPRRLRGLAIVRGERTPVLRMRVVNERGLPIDLTNFESILRSMMTDKRDQARVKRRMKRLGFRLIIGQHRP